MRHCCLLLLFCVLSAHGQQLIFGTVRDAFLKSPLPGAKVSLLAADSTVVQDSVPLSIRRDENGKVQETSFFLQLEKKTCKYFLRATCKGYSDAWATLDVDANETRAFALDDPLELRRVREINLGEAAVTATKLKVYYRGNTLVYDATAFKLPEGSMLDDFSRRLRGQRLVEPAFPEWQADRRYRSLRLVPQALVHAVRGERARPRGDVAADASQLRHAAPDVPFQQDVPAQGQIELKLARQASRCI